MIPSTFVQGDTSPDVGAKPAASAPAKRESIASFSDVSKMTDPRLTIRRHRMRRVFTGVMAGALALLVLAGVCSLVRRPSAAPDISKVSEPASPVAAEPVVTAAPMAEPAPAAPSPAAETEEVPLASAATSKTPLSRTHRPKPAPRKARGTR